MIFKQWKIKIFEIKNHFQIELKQEWQKKKNWQKNIFEFFFKKNPYNCATVHLGAAPNGLASPVTSTTKKINSK